MKHYESLNTRADELASALSLKVDRTASFLQITERNKGEVNHRKTVKEGWATETQVATEEGLLHYSHDSNQRKVSDDILQGFPSKPLDRTDLAPLGYKLS